jgi:hypothetical protein
MSKNQTKIDILYDILHKPTDTPEMKKVLRDIPVDIRTIFKSNEPYNSRTIMWQYWWRSKYSELGKSIQDEYKKTLYAINYEPSVHELKPPLNIDYREATKKSRGDILNAVKKNMIDDINDNDTKTDKYSQPSLDLLFESEKASIIAIIMQTDDKLNKGLEKFLVKLIILVSQGIEICRKLDTKCGVNGDDGNYDLIQLLNLSMPLQRKKSNMDPWSAHATPGSFTITRDTLSIDGIKKLNFREKVQLMNCFWNCSSHPFEGIDGQDKNKGKGIEIYGETETTRCSNSYLKVRTKTGTAPVLNMITEKILKNLHLITDLNRYDKISRFINKINNFNTKLGEVTNRIIPKNHKIPSGRFPLCYDYNESKESWKQVVENLEPEDKYLFDIQINNDFLKNIEDRVRIAGTSKDSSGANNNSINISLSDREREYMIEHEGDNTIKENIRNGHIYWTSGFNVTKLNMDGILAYNILREAEVTDDIARGVEENAESKNKFKYIRSGLSGSTWKYLQLAYLLGETDLNMMYHIALAYLVGCYHHSWYEVTRSALDFKAELQDSSATIFPDTLSKITLDVDDRYWVLNRDTLLFKVGDVGGPENTSLSDSTKLFIKHKVYNFRSDAVELDNKSHENYKEFYRKFLFPLMVMNKKIVNTNRHVGNVDEYLTVLDTATSTERKSSRQRKNTVKMNLGGGKGKKSRKRKSKFPYLSVY